MRENRCSQTTINIPITTNIDRSIKKLDGKKSRNIDLLEKWEHDMYDEREQTRKNRNDLFTSHIYNIQEETNAHRDERYCKNGHITTVKNTQIWQDTKFYTEAGREKVGSGGQERRCAGNLINKNETKFTPSKEYHSKLPTNDTKLPTKLLRKVTSIIRDQDRKNTAMHSTTGPFLKYGPITATSKKYLNFSQNRNDQLKHQTSGFLPLCPSILKFYNHSTRNIIGKKINSTPATQNSALARDKNIVFNQKSPQ
ncbi:Hypothetical protein CINCED_3A017196 [Cinara cedri]|uniref:Uncharacterized protein n=1 Tax=Cinara cedri TaxID=506608 RepID=A0A5E4M7W3_9HEMI|nr:Hypothetical protein CINCED_3A017196 [Cinara cedri]